ncbi:hypothetical protein [uncultured Gelidibacter sp.]|nr:hypothetical protein [uncultured Gelidibacter sp.]
MKLPLLMLSKDDHTSAVAANGLEPQKSQLTSLIYTFIYIKKSI